jgi:hypothetical protein
VTLCVRCTKPIFEGDTGWYSQQPFTDPAVPGLTFMDRVTECEDEHVHVPATPEQRERLLCSAPENHLPLSGTGETKED